MFANSKKFVTPLVVLLVACMTVEAVTMPQWCICQDKTSQACVTVGGNFDGHTCGISDEVAYYNFGGYCRNTPYTASKAVCWGHSKALMLQQPHIILLGPRHFGLTCSTQKVCHASKSKPPNIDPKLHPVAALSRPASKSDLEAA
ncbi:hypothetical protein BGZ99_003132 [Dissophora globulifera]|uniref:Secreted protein n=1 Tax=Dissophora globulifera TaxID=979702 RepID=A0A9P6RP26_9FUNG|nr:hypothetical protein BGZ99_003132 [Dissophora globulifera]